ncbi:hypothetical protein KR009_008958 [Drosophila setifemur]|nr:hypothetical protein KR009_008958 [Drosophila setifemur]
MRLTLCLLVLIALIAVATEAQNRQKRTNSKALAVRTNKKVQTRAGTVKKRSVSARRSTAATKKKSVVIINSNGSSSTVSSGSSSSSSSSSTPSARCVNASTSCYSTRNVCGRWSRTRRCHRFKNNCLLERTNCRARGSSWNMVNVGNCTSISVNRTGTCSSTFSSSNSGWSSILSNILGSSSSSSNVVPIIIRTG